MSAAEIERILGALANLTNEFRMLRDDVHELDKRFTAKFFLHDDAIEGLTRRDLEHDAAIDTGQHDISAAKSLLAEHAAELHRAKAVAALIGIGGGGALTEAIRLLVDILR
jgi:hypothetical protein